MHDKDTSYCATPRTDQALWSAWTPTGHGNSQTLEMAVPFLITYMKLLSAWILNIHVADNLNPEQ